MSYSSKLSHLASRTMTPVSMRTLLDSGTGKLLPGGVRPLTEIDRKKLARLQIASFLHRELPVRFAHRVRDLDKLPYGLNEMKSIQAIQHQYVKSAEDLQAIALEKGGVSTADALQVKDVLSLIYERHSDTLIEIAKGLSEWKKSQYGKNVLDNGKMDLSDLKQLHQFLDRFFISRIGIRVLIGHYLELFHPPRDNYVGIVCLHTSPAAVAQSAAEDARYMCERHFGNAPNVEMLGRTDLTFSYVPSHLYYILFEVLKNSMRAVMEHHTEGKPLPPISIIIADGECNEDVAIKISDLGGGIPRRVVSRIFSYLFTTAGPVNLNEEGLQDFSRENPLAGLGYGLPISRDYCRYFGGELKLYSMEGYGTDTFIHLSRLVDNEEPLP